MKLPSVRFINYRKLFPQAGVGCWTKWFDVQRFWGGKIIVFYVKAFAIELDFRRDWMADMITGNVDGDTEKAALLVVFHQAKQLMDFLRSNTGDTADWPIDIVTDDPRAAQLLAENLTSLWVAIKAVRDAKPHQPA